MKFLFFFIALVTGLKADMIILATGNRMLGTIMEVTETKVVMSCDTIHPDIPPRKVTVARKDVIRIIRDTKGPLPKTIKTIRLPQPVKGKP